MSTGLPSLADRAASRLRRTAAQLEPRLVWARADGWVRDRMARRRYRVITPEIARRSRKSDTIFVFGSGYSVNSISPDGWEHIARHDTISFNWFVHQNFTRMDYHLVREVAATDLRREIWEPELRRFGALVAGNPHYRNTIFLVQRGWRAASANRLLGLGLLPAGASVLRFRNSRSRTDRAPSASFAAGLSHDATTVGDCVNFAALMGWRTIVIAGVDLYDHRYFWLSPEQERESVRLKMRGLRLDDPFPLAGDIVATLGAWARAYEAQGIRLYAYNPRSLLTEQLPVYPRADLIPS